MKMHELYNEAEILKPDFSKGRGKDNPGIEIPKGFDRFRLDHKEGSNIAKIIGIKGNKEYVVSTGHLAAERELVKIYNGGKSDKILTPISLMAAFGSKEMNALRAVGINFVEKPSHWTDVKNKHDIYELTLKKAEKAIGKIKSYSGTDRKSVV